MSLLQSVDKNASHPDYHRKPQRSAHSGEESPRGRGAGLILGCWLYVVFVVAITSRAESLAISSIGRVALATAVLWPLLYFIIGNCKFMPSSIKTGSLVAILLFALFALVASLLASADIITSASYLVITLGALDPNSLALVAIEHSRRCCIQNARRAARSS